LITCLEESTEFVFREDVWSCIVLWTLWNLGDGNVCPFLFLDEFQEGYYGRYASMIRIFAFGAFLPKPVIHHLLPKTRYVTKMLGTDKVEAIQGFGYYIFEVG
ncbi:MAG: hypothetical protein IJ633_03970, partial [Prevotella sp.]|nr:hypothetical protein [Prevotella sp.]